MLKVVIVEDELHSRETLKNLVNDYCEQVEIIALAASIQEGIHVIQTHQPDLVFLDIEMPGGTGFDLLEKLQYLNFEVVFTTAFEHYALKAIKFSAIDYLLKPIDVEELQIAIAKVQQKKHSLRNKKLEILLNNMQVKNRQEQTITLSTSEGFEFIPVTEILYCEANGSYTNFHLKASKTLLVSKHLKEYENLLAEHNFMRVHHSYLINLSEVKKYIKADGGYIVMKDDSVVNISLKKKEEFLDQMKRIGG
ncbi:LytTR family DNA-binding domain-containing protein [Fulvivirgaceae bacterium BMA10]|uniref:LytTR family DNA-binding domain-containing protein n=1 Tax=Splendidivirga corallicola TaxID=3051826 RepID=A0ABT8KPS2_9BACT|nr:LytTR family DNA-binding domain-containing protein [Fulvivirgaceae bacterium BMA10]